MTLQPNGTHAKDIALHFIQQTVGRATPAIMKRTIVQAKSLLQSGYTKEEIMNVIDYIVNVKHIEMYSLGYVSTCINDVLKIISSDEKEATSKETREALATVHEQDRKEVVSDGSSADRNRNKANRFGLKSRFGEEFTGDLSKIK